MKGVVLLVLCLFLLSGCALTGAVVDSSKAETKLENLTLTEYPYLKFYYGGAIRECSLKAINSLRIDPVASFVYQGELYYGVNVAFRNGNSLPLEKNSSSDEIPVCFVSVQNMIKGNYEGGSLRIPLDQITQLIIEE